MDGREGGLSGVVELDVQVWRSRESRDAAAMESSLWLVGQGMAGVCSLVPF